MMDEALLAARLKAELKPARWEHTRGVLRTAERLARRHGVDPARARLAALLHDCGKALEREALKRHLKEAGADAQERALPALWHAPVGAWRARHVYGCRDGEILAAVRFHSTGAPGQSPLQKLLFVADYIEPGRPAWPELPALRSLARRDLGAAWGQVLKHKLTDLLGRERPLHPRSLAAYHDAFGHS
jgi:predicted HD superfamily hydrolase involved in NAD metabolism